MHSIFEDSRQNSLFRPVVNCVHVDNMMQMHISSQQGGQNIFYGYLVAPRLTCRVTTAVCLKSNVNNDLHFFNHHSPMISLHTFNIVYKPYYILYIMCITMYIFVMLAEVTIELNSIFQTIKFCLTILTKKTIVLRLHIFYGRSVIFQGTLRKL